MPTVTVKTGKGRRTESWPDQLVRGRVAIEEARAKYAPTLADLHTLDLLGLSEAVAAEILLRKPGLELSAIHTDLKPKTKGAHV